MTTKSNFGLIGMALLACLFIAPSVNAQLYGDLNDNGQNNIGIGLSTPSAKLHLYNSGSTSATPTTLRLQQQIGGNYSNGIWDFSVSGGMLNLNYNVYRYFTNYSGTALSIGYDNVLQAHKISLLEYTDFAKTAIFAGNVGIGTTSPVAGLHVKEKDIVITDASGTQAFKVGDDGVPHIKGLLIKDASGTNQLSIDNDGFVIARQIDVNLGFIPDVPDYVFEDNYNLMPLEELEEYLKKYKHLPKIKSANEYGEIGSINVGELQLQLLEKVEELTLYVIELENKIKKLEQSNSSSK